MADEPKINFRSDNESAVAPEIMAALERANSRSAHSYGEDAITARLGESFGELFETGVEVFPVVTGTAANALAIAQLAPSYGEVYCHQHSHLHTDECGAPEFYSGGAKLISLGGDDAKIDSAEFARILSFAGELGDHQCKPCALSLSQATELGTVYQTDEVARLAAIAHDRGLGVHMDGARFANAVQRLGCTPAEVSWKAGVDLLSFGATKNGAMGAEALLVFDPALSHALGRRRKRGGHLLSKMRYVSAQLEAYIKDDLWLRLAARANRCADELAAGVSGLPGVELVCPVQANEVFLRMAEGLARRLREAGYEFLRWTGASDIYRFVLTFSSERDAIAEFLKCAGRLAGDADAAPAPQGALTCPECGQSFSPDPREMEAGRYLQCHHCGSFSALVSDPPGATGSAWTLQKLRPE